MSIEVNLFLPMPINLLDQRYSRWDYFPQGDRIYAVPGEADQDARQNIGRKAGFH